MRGRESPDEKTTDHGVTWAFGALLEQLTRSNHLPRSH